MVKLDKKESLVSRVGPESGLCMDSVREDEEDPAAGNVLFSIEM